MRRILIAASLAIALGGAIAPQPAAAAEKSKTIILGFDGADAKLTEQWMDEGKLPNLARLRDAGTFPPLRSTIPSQTPVSWSTFSTGLNPGRHGDLRLPEARPRDLSAELRRRRARASASSCSVPRPRGWQGSGSACCWRCWCSACSSCSAAALAAAATVGLALGAAVGGVTGVEAAKLLPDRGSDGQ